MWKLRRLVWPEIIRRLIIMNVSDTCMSPGHAAILLYTVWQVLQLFLWELLGTLRSNDATATRTSLKKWIWVFSYSLYSDYSYPLTLPIVGEPSRQDFRITPYTIMHTFKNKRQNKTKPLGFQLLFFWRSRCRPRHWILKSLLTDETQPTIFAKKRQLYVI